MARKKAFGGISLTERDGHAWHYDEDWGPVFHFGDKLPCCGCKLGVGAKAAVCDDCRCHDVHRMFHSLPAREAVAV